MRSNLDAFQRPDLTIHATFDLAHPVCWPLPGQTCAAVDVRVQQIDQQKRSAIVSRHRATEDLPAPDLLARSLHPSPIEAGLGREQKFDRELPGESRRFLWQLAKAPGLRARENMPRQPATKPGLEQDRSAEPARVLKNLRPQPGSRVDQSRRS